MERVDLLSFKAKMRCILKDNDARYWEMLKKFSQAKLTKRELDEMAKQLLGSDDNLIFHNLLIKSIVNNAYCSYGPPAIPPSLDKKGLVVNQKKAKKEKKLLKPKSGKPDLATPTKKGIELAPITSTTSTTTTTQTPVSQTPLQQSAAIQLPVVTVPGCLINRPEFNMHILNSPDLLLLRNRMHRTAAEKGLSHVSNESVLAMMSAVEQYLKQILQNVRAEERIQPPSYPSASPPPAPIKLITAEDLLQAVEIRPKVMGEDLSINLERIGLTL